MYILAIVIALAVMATIAWPHPWSYVWLAPIDLAIGISAFGMAPFIVLFTSAAGVSPFWAWPWLTDDDPIDGDAGHLLRWPSNTKWGIFERRVAWLWRNRGYNFSTSICGREMSGTTHFWGNRNVSDSPMVEGICYAYNNGMWEMYCFYPLFKFMKRGLRIRIGWKIPLSEDVPSGKAMMVEYLNPVDGWD